MPMDPTVEVALITAIPSTIAAVGVLLAASNRKHIGRSNGKGTIVEMLENAIQWQGEHQASDLAVAQELRDGQERVERLLAAQNKVEELHDAAAVVRQTS